MRIVASIAFCPADIALETRAAANKSHFFLPGNSSVKEGDNITLTCAPGYVRYPYRQDDVVVGHLKCEQNTLRLAQAQGVECRPRE